MAQFQVALLADQCCLDWEPAASLPSRLRSCVTVAWPGLRFTYGRVLFSPLGVSRFGKLHMKFQMSDFSGSLEPIFLHSSNGFGPQGDSVCRQHVLSSPPLPTPALSLPF